MGLMSGIYDSGPIQPLLKFKENYAIRYRGLYRYYRADYIEGITPSSQSLVDMVQVAGATQIAANGTIAKQVVNTLQLNEGELLHLRWEPLDYVEGILWEPAGSSKFQTRNIQSRVDPMTKFHDPWLCSTTFWILGNQLDANIEVRNPIAVAVPHARFQFWGWRYLLADITPNASALKSREDRLKLETGDPDAVRRYVGPCTLIPAEAIPS